MNKMKRALSLLLALLMVMTLIPFAAVSAADGPTIVVSTDAEEYNAGDEVTVEVYLKNNPGLIGAQVEIDYDKSAMELVTYYDEDEEMWMPQIEVGSKWNVSSNKYIMFGPINEETGVSKNCLVQYARGTATAAQVVTNELFFTATFKIKDDAYSGTYELNMVRYNRKNFIQYGNDPTDFAIENATITINGTEPEVPSCEHQYDGDCDADCNLCGEIREAAAHVYDSGYACDDDCNVCGAIREVTHTYVYQCDQHCNECGERTNSSANHSVLHKDAAPPVSCIEYGNIEYWYCEHCGIAWTDEALNRQTNQMSVRIAGECVSDSPACKDGACINCSLPYLAEADHTYDSDTDCYCNVCEEYRFAIITEPKSIQTKNGATAKTSIEVVGDGLTYQWYIKNAGKTKYSKSSVTKATYSTTMSDSSRDRYVYCIVTDKNGNEIKSKTVVLRMAASIIKEPATAAYAKKGATVKVKITASGDDLKYQWYIKNDGKSTYSKSSVTSATYSTTMSSSSKGRRIYCVVTDKYGKKVQSKTFILREAVSITKEPATATYAKNGATAKVTITASGDGLKYQWYIKNAGSSKYSKSSITKSTYSVKMSDKVNGRRIYCVVTDKYGKKVQSKTMILKKK